MLKRIFTVLFLVLGYFYARSQTTYTIQGKVVDSSGAAMPGATIQVSDTRDSARMLSDGNGRFKFQGLSERSFTILVTMKGYMSYRGKIVVPDDVREYILPLLVLQTEYEWLQTVTIQQVIPITFKTDTTEFHAAAYSMREGTMLADLMKKLPGIVVNPDSSVFVMGKQVKKILVDGKAFFGTNIQAALQNLPYDIIDKVQVIDDYGDLARLTGVKTGEPEKVLNIELKKDKRNGLLGSVQGGLGNEDQYTAILVANAFAGERKISLIAAAINNNPFGKEATKSMNLNYANRFGPGWMGSGDGGWSGDRHFFQTGSIQDYRLAGDQTHLEQSNSNSGSRQQQQAGYEWHFGPARNREVRINTSFSHQQSSETNLVTTNSSETDSGFSKSSQSAAVNQLHSNNINAETRVYYAQAFPNSGHRLSFDGDLKYMYSGQAGDNLTATQVRADSLSSNSIQHYKLDNTNRGWDVSAGLHYYIPLGKGGLVETGYTLHHTLNNSVRNWQQPDSSGTKWTTLDSLSNAYAFGTMVQDFRTGYTRHGGKTDLDLALIAEPGSLQGRSPDKGSVQSYHYFNFFPTGSFSYSIDRANKIVLGYNTSVAAPSLQQVQPVTDLSNPQYPVTGNPGLKPSLSQAVSLNFEQNALSQSQYHGFSIGLGYSAVSNQIIADVVHPHDTSSVIQQTYFENVNGVHSLSLNWRVDLPAWLKKRLKLSLSGTVGENYGFSMAEHVLYSTELLTATENLNIVYSIPDRLEFNGYVIYNYSNTRYGIPGVPVSSAAGITWGMNNHHYLKNWTLSYEFMEAFYTGSHGGLSRNPLVMNLHLLRSFLKTKQAIGGLSMINVFNSNGGTSQTVTNTNISQNRSAFLGRAVLFTLQWNFERFKK